MPRTLERNIQESEAMSNIPIHVTATNDDNTEQARSTHTISGSTPHLTVLFRDKPIEQEGTKIEHDERRYF